MGDQPGAPVPLLFLIGDTGGGHRSAAVAVREALGRDYPGQFAPVIADPLAGPGAPPRLRWLVTLYGPGIRLAPWLWGLLWRVSDRPRALALLRRTLFAAAGPVVAEAVRAHRPAVIVAFHAMVTRPAVQARGHARPGAPVLTVVTDLVTAHRAWREPGVDLIVVPSPAVARSLLAGGLPPGRCAEAGVPVTADFAAGPLPADRRRARRRALGVSADQFLVVVTGGAEGAGGIYRQALAIAREFHDITVVALCGRNRRLRRRLARRAPRFGGRLVALGFVNNMADWLRCADVVVTKAGPGTIAEAACCAAPLILTSRVPGQEEGNAQLVAAAGAGRWAPRLPEVLAAVGELRRDPAALARMRAAATAISRPDAAAATAALIAGLAGYPGRWAGSPKAGNSASVSRNA